MADNPPKARAGEASRRILRFHCPVCGFGDEELGHRLTVDEIHCEICLSTDERLVVRLRRWEEEP